MVDHTTSKSVISSSDVAFPRGGATALSALEIKDISNEATKDVLFEASSASKRSGSSKSDQPAKKAKKGAKKNATKSAEDESEEKSSVQIENFSFKNLIPGTQVLGQIVQAGRLDLTLSVGDNLVGYVPITSISEEITAQIEKFEEEEDDDSEDEKLQYDDEEKDQEVRTATIKTKTSEFPVLSKIFKVGQWLRAKVVKSSNESKKKRIQFSIEPEVVNSSLEDDDLTTGNLLQGSIKSIEDHGIILNIGKSNFSGFISNKELKNTKDIEVEGLNVGDVLLTSIVSKPSSRTINLRPVESNSTSKKASISTISSIDAIEPGILVDALVSDITKNGIVTKVFGLVFGTINLANLNDFDLQTLKHKYTIGNTIKARVVGVLLKSGTKKLMLSQLPRIIAFSSKPISDDSSALEAFPIGHVFEEIEVKGSDPNYIFAGLGSSTLYGQIHNSKIDPLKSLDVDYSIGSKHRARVIDYNLMENLLVLTMEPKLIDSKYLTVDDIRVGEFVNGGEIIKVLPDSGGIIVKIFDEFEALVPGNHMSDVKLVYPERKFKVGAKIKGRVLRKQGKKLFLTLKKSLVNIENAEVLSVFEDAKVGFKTPATVEKFVHNGAIVSFFDNLKAYLPKNEISETFVNQASDHLKLGQTVNVKILNVNENDRRLMVTLRQSLDLSESQKASITDLIPGKSIIKAIVVEKAKESVIVELENSNLRGVIFTGHLSDGNYEQNRVIFKKLPIGDNLEVLVLEKDLKARSVTVSAKASLIKAAKQNEIPAYFKDVKVNDKMLHGYIRSVTSMGLFVSFAGKLTGLVLAKYATNKPDEDLSKIFYKYQSVSCRVIRIDEENKRFLLSLKKSENEKDSSNSEEAINPIDASKATLGDYTPGVVTSAIVKSIKGTQLNVQLADNLQGRVDITQCFNSWSDIKDKNQPLSQFHKNDKIKVKVIGFHDAKNHRFLPITHRKSNKNIILELSMLDKELNTPDEPYHTLNLSNISEGSNWIAYINNVAKGFVWVSITPTIKGRISFMELSDDVSVFDDIENKLPIGTAIQATVKDIDNDHNTIVLSSRNNSVTSIKDIKTGDKLPARVLKVRDTFVLVELGKNVVASSFITDALNDYTEKLESVFHTNDFCTATILAIDEGSNKIAVSLRNEEANNKVINSVKDLSRGDVVRGFVKNVANNGVYVALGRSVHALVRITDLSDSYLKDWKKYFKPHQPIIGKISSCKEEGRILMTLKESEINGELNVLKKFEDLEVGEIFEGSVRRVTDFGAFIKLDGTVNISGLCHHTEIADNKVENVSSLFGEGDRVKVKILAIDQAKKQLSLGMKASYFTNSDSSSEQEDVEMSDVNDEDNENESESEFESDEERENDESDDEVMEDVFENKSTVGDIDSDSDFDEEPENSKLSGPSGLSTNGFDWTASILDQAEDNYSSSDEEDFTHEKRKKKKKNFIEDKTADLNTRAPQSVSDFERLLVGNPNSSIMWMNYMSFQLQLSEVDKAREIGERALKVINYREEQEKMNIWIALLNLENTFGTDETLEDTFKRSCQFMDSLAMHQKLVSIYTMSEKFNKADELYKVMCKKFGMNVSIWVQYGSSLLDRKLNDDAREILARSLQVLPKKDHIEVVRKFGQLEFNKGDPEQGRSLFEGLLSDVPKRTDLWNVYIDQEIKQDNKVKVEDLFERVITKKLSRKQAKFFFSKWLSFEEEKGDQQYAARVKAKAAEYVQSHQKDE